MPSKKEVDQYRLMLERIAAFEDGQIRIDQLVNDLEGLLNTLENPDLPWKQSFLHEWGALEDVRAVALFKREIHFNDSTTKLLQAACAQLRTLVLNKLHA